MENLIHLLLVVLALAAVNFWLSARKWRRITEQWRGWGSEFSHEIAALKTEAEVLVAERDALRRKLVKVRELVRDTGTYPNRTAKGAIREELLLILNDKET